MYLPNDPFCCQSELKCLREVLYKIKNIKEKKGGQNYTTSGDTSSSNYKYAITAHNRKFMTKLS